MHCIETVCFDYYGTLVKIGKPYVRIRKWMCERLAEQGKEALEAAFYYCFTKRRLKLLGEGKTFLRGADAMAQGCMHACRTFDVNIDEDRFRGLLWQMFREPPAFKEAHTALSQLKRKYRIGLLTNADNDVLYESIRLQGFHFDFICSSEDMRSNKPQPAFFAGAAARHALDRQHTMMVGDSLTEDILPAAEMGWTSVLAVRGQEKVPPEICCVKSLTELSEILRQK